MKKLLLIPLMFIAFLASAQKVDRQEVEQMQKQIDKEIPVGVTYYVCDIDQFTLIFQDRNGRLTAIQDLQKDYQFKRGQDKYDPMITIVFDEDIDGYRTAETLKEHRLEADNILVVKKLYSEIIEYRRTRIE